MKTRTQKIRQLAECSMLVALATVLSFVKIYEAPLGGAVTLFSMVPILICGFVYGVKAGFASAFVYSVIQLLLGIGTVAYVSDPWGIVGCIFLDYIVAFSALGVAGFFKKLRFTQNEKVNRYLTVTLGSLLALLLRFVSHVVGGALIWYSITKAEEWNQYVLKYGKWAYSLIYNSWYMVPEIILTLIAVPVSVYLINLVWGKMLKKDASPVKKEEREGKPIGGKQLAFMLFGIALLLGGILLSQLLDGVVFTVLGVVIGLGGLILAFTGLVESK